MFSMNTAKNWLVNVLPIQQVAMASTAAIGMACFVNSLSAGTVQAATFDLDITATADNAYRIYLGTDTSVFQDIGGTLSTSNAAIRAAENYSIQIEDTDYLYVAAWSDDGVVQGLSIDILNQTTGELIESGDLRWEVASTGFDLDNTLSPVSNLATGTDGSYYFPTLSELNTQLAAVNSQTNPSSGWQEVSVATQTNSQIFGAPVPNFSPDSRLMWYDSGDQSSSNAPFRGGFNHEEYLIFRISAESTAVPEPTMTLLGSLACLGVGTILKRKQSKS